MTKEDSIRNFDTNNPAINGNIFSLPFTADNAAIVIIPVPWEVTVSYHGGTAKAPLAILKASSQVDLCVKDIVDAWKLGIAMLPVSQQIQEASHILRKLSTNHIRAFENGDTIPPDDPVISKINEACETLNIYIKSTAQKLIKQGKIVALLGGDHSTPLGLLRALSEHYDRFGILQIDAHADLRKAYEGFTYSHASIMYNALKLDAINKLVQVGVRDYGDEELQMIQRSNGRIATFFDQDLKSNLYKGKTWDSICDAIIKELPQQVYISFDIDGLDPKLCPHTGTPVPGGLEFDQALYLIKKVAYSGKKIIGFDLNEVAPEANDWDANVGARLLFNLCNWTGVSQKKLKSI